MKIHLYLLFFTVALGVSGCAALTDKPVTVILKNTETLEFVTCDVDHWNMPGSFKKNDDCVEEYKKKGYVVWGTR